MGYTKDSIKCNFSHEAPLFLTLDRIARYGTIICSHRVLSFPRLQSEFDVHKEAILVDDLVKQLLEAGVHFGHQTKKWDPRMKRYIHGEKGGIYVIDLEKTAHLLREACRFLTDIVSRGGEVLFAGTKPQAQEIVRAEAERGGAYYVCSRWLGGTLTNFETIRKSIKRYEELLLMREDGTFEKLTKKEVAKLSKEIGKFEKNLGGIVKMIRLPAAVYVVDAQRELIAIKEALKLGIPVVAIVDTNTNPEIIQYPIPGNDDAIRSLSLITKIITDSILEGKTQRAAKEATASGEKSSEKNTVAASA